MIPAVNSHAFHVSAKILLFDFDGTIADTRAIALRILNELSEEFHFRAVLEEEVQEVRDMTTQKLLRFLGVSHWRLPMITRSGLLKFQASIAEVQPIPKIPQVLAELKARGFRLAILTSNSEANVITFLKQHHLDFFDFIYTSSKLFGKSYEIRRLMKEHQLKAEEIIYVADETRDIEATQAVPIRIAAVTWGYNSASILASMEPDFLFHQPEELLALQISHS
ncbi:MAG: HAD-IA family hydrolase [Chthoniobacterales bacterium]